MKKKLSISVLVITWNQKQLLSRCLENLCAKFDFDEDEIVVIDNGSHDDTSEMINERFPSVRFYRLEENIGVGPARNRGIMVAEKDIIMTLDNDAYLTTPFSTLKASINDAHLHNPDLGVMGFKLCFPDGTYQFNGRRFPGFVQPFYSRIPFLRSIRYFKKQFNSHLNVDLEQISSGLHEVDYLLGANQIFMRKWLVKTGIYDESIFFGPEDLEFCWRVKRAGGRNMINMSVGIIHDYQRRTRRINKIFFKHVYAFYRTWLKMNSLKGQIQNLTQESDQNKVEFTVASETSNAKIAELEETQRGAQQQRETGASALEQLRSDSDKMTAKSEQARAASVERISGLEGALAEPYEKLNVAVSAEAVSAEQVAEVGKQLRDLRAGSDTLGQERNYLLDALTKEREAIASIRDEGKA